MLLKYCRFSKLETEKKDTLRDLPSVEKKIWLLSVLQHLGDSDRLYIPWNTSFSEGLSTLSTTTRVSPLSQFIYKCFKHRDKLQ